MMEEKRLVPKKRFKGFETKKSLQEYLGELTDIRTGPFGSSLHARDYVEDGIPIITTEHFKEGYLPRDKSGIPQVSYEDYLRLNAYKLQSGDIVFSRVGSVDINALTTNVQDGWLFSGRVLRVRVRSQEQLSSLYLHYLLETKRVKKDVVARAVGQTMPSINTEILNETRIIKTNNSEEQQKIGEFFKVLDERIANQERKIAKVKALKSAYLTEMFPQDGETVPKRRFKGFNGEWEKYKLKEYSNLITKGTTPIDKSGKGIINFIKVENIKKGKVFPETKITEKEHENYLKRSKLEVNDILFSIAGTLGRVAIVEETILPANTNQALAIIRGYNFDTNFLLTTLSGQVITEFIKRNPTIGAQPNLSLEQVGNFIIYTPEFEEQQKIGQFFKNIDDQITTEQKKLAKLKQMKEAYLEEMFV